jgi:hypothetical protein
MADLLTWWMSGPVAGVLCSPAGAPVAGAAALAAVAAGAGLGASYDRLTVAARHGVVTAALVVAVYAPITHSQGGPR